MLLILIGLIAGLTKQTTAAMLATAAAFGLDLVYLSNLLGTRGAMPVSISGFDIATAFSQITIAIFPAFLVGLAIRSLYRLALGRRG